MNQARQATALRGADALLSWWFARHPDDPFRGQRSSLEFPDEKDEILRRMRECFPQSPQKPFMTLCAALAGNDGTLALSSGCFGYGILRRDGRYQQVEFRRRRTNRGEKASAALVAATPRLDGETRAALRAFVRVTAQELFEELRARVGGDVRGDLGAVMDTWAASRTPALRTALTASIDEHLKALFAAS